MTAKEERATWIEARAILGRPASNPRPLQRKAYRRHWRAPGSLVDHGMAVGVLRRALEGR